MRVVAVSAKLVLGGLVAALIASSSGASAGLARTAKQMTTDEIVVVGSRQLEQQVRTFVQALSAPPSGEDQLARWDRNICPGVAGLSQRQAQFVIDRIALRAAAVGLRPGRAGCRANLIIFVAPNADVFARGLVERYPALVGYAGGGTRGPQALQDFIGEPRPVRWWHVAFNVRAAWATGRGSLGPLTRRARQDVDRAIIIVDAARAAGVRVDALADYLAMAALAQIDPDADTAGYSTILNLFADLPADSKPTALTSWDTAYLQGLYDMSRFAIHSSAQERQVSRDMVEALVDIRRKHPR